MTLFCVCKCISQPGLYLAYKYGINISIHCLYTAAYTYKVIIMNIQKSGPCAVQRCVYFFYVKSVPKKLQPCKLTGAYHTMYTRIYAVGLLCRPICVPTYIYELFIQIPRHQLCGGVVNVSKKSSVLQFSVCFLLKCILYVVWGCRKRTNKSVSI